MHFKSVNQVEQRIKFIHFDEFIKKIVQKNDVSLPRQIQGISPAHFPKGEIF